MVGSIKYTRRASHEVVIGGYKIGGNNPIAVQSMTNTPTADVEASVAQTERIERAGAEIVRLTAQGKKEGEALQPIMDMLRSHGSKVAIVADIHFTPEIAMIAAEAVDKVRINPGNFRTSNGELERLIAICRRRGVALRIGVNHGSLAKRVFDIWGDTPEGMVESAMEFLKMCREADFHEVVVSMKSSNTRVMVHAYRLLVEAMAKENMTYPLHIGVTEAGDGIEGRIKSAVGIGALLADGIGFLIDCHVGSKVSRCAVNGDHDDTGILGPKGRPLLAALTLVVENRIVSNQNDGGAGILGLDFCVAGTYKFRNHQ